MKHEYVAGCAIGLLMLLTGCSDTPAPPVDTSAADIKAVKDAETAWAADAAAKNVDKLVAHYADDASLMIPDMPAAKGKDAIRGAMTGLFSDPNAALTMVSSDAQVAKGGDLAYTQGTYSLTVTNPKTKKAEIEKGKYVTVYKKQTDGSWKAVVDINNADAPAVPVAGAARTKAKAAAPAKKKRK